MAASWILLHNIPATGKRFVLEDQSVWTDPIAEFGLACRILDPLRAEFLLLAQDDGVLIRGKVTGKVAVPCNRCMEDAIVPIAQSVDTFEPYPAPFTKEDADMDVDAELLRPAPNGQGVEINLAALAWEEFSLALPMKPLCAPGCKGLCPSCGANKNTAPCACVADTTDPRLAVLKGLKVRAK